MLGRDASLFFYYLKTRITMDIVQTLQIEIQTRMNTQTFEINSVLSNPADKDALNRLEKAVRSYSLLSEQLNTLNRLAQQIKDNSQKPVDN